MQNQIPNFHTAIYFESLSKHASKLNPSYFHPKKVCEYRRISSKPTFKLRTNEMYSDRSNPSRKPCKITKKKLDAVRMANTAQIFYPHSKEKAFIVTNIMNKKSKVSNFPTIPQRLGSQKITEKIDHSFFQETGFNFRKNNTTSEFYIKPAVHKEKLNFVNSFMTKNLLVVEEKKIIYERTETKEKSQEKENICSKEIFANKNELFDIKVERKLNNSFDFINSAKIVANLNAPERKIKAAATQQNFFKPKKPIVNIDEVLKKARENNRKNSAARTKDFKAMNSANFAKASKPLTANIYNSRPFSKNFTYNKANEGKDLAFELILDSFSRWHKFEIALEIKDIGINKEMEKLFIPPSDEHVLLSCFLYKEKAGDRVIYTTEEEGAKEIVKKWKACYKKCALLWHPDKIDNLVKQLKLTNQEVINLLVKKSPVIFNNINLLMKKVMGFFKAK